MVCIFRIILVIPTIIAIPNQINPIIGLIAKNNAAAKMLNADFFASKLEFKNGICTGRISNDLLGAKNKIFEYENIDLVVTDNLSDLELVKKSSKSIILSTPKNIGFWERNGLTVDYILED